MRSKGSVKVARKKSTGRLVRTKVKINSNVLQGEWRKIRGNLQALWGQITGQRRRRIRGRFDQLVGDLQIKYGRVKQGAGRQARHILKQARGH